MELRTYDEKTRRLGVKAPFYDVCEWWIETYPADIFIKEPKPIVEARLCMQNILSIQVNKKEEGLPPTDKSVGIPLRFYERRNSKSL